MNEITTPNDFEKELAKSIGKETAKSIFGFVNSILGPPSEEIGGYLQDIIKFHRFKNQIKILQKAKEFVERSGCEPNKIKLKILSNILEHSALENEDYMQEKWAGLLANVSISPHSSRVGYLRGGARLNIDISLTEILKQLTSSEAKALDILYKFFLAHHDMEQDLTKTLPIDSFHGLIYDDTDFMIMVDNLERNNLVKSINTWEIHLTSLGYRLVDRCTPPHIKKEYDCNDPRN